MRNGSKSFMPDCPVEERPTWMKVYAESLPGRLNPLPGPGEEMTYRVFSASMCFFHGWQEGIKSVGLFAVTP